MTIKATVLAAKRKNMLSYATGLWREKVLAPLAVGASANLTRSALLRRPAAGAGELRAGADEGPRQQHQGQPGDEAADMRPDGEALVDAGGAADGGEAAEELQKEPEAYQQKRGDR